MSAANDIFIASERELEVLNERGSPAEKLHGVCLFAADLVMLCTLEAILTGADWESIFDKHYVSPLIDDGPEGPWVYLLSGSLQAALATTPGEVLPECAERWAETDDWMVRDDCSNETILSVLGQLKELATKAAAEEKRMYLWTAL